jgi:predicted homoserine dehydrogenase-like protein
MTPGFRCVAVADLDVARTMAFVRSLGESPREAQSLASVTRAVEAGQIAVLRDGNLLATLPQIDVVIEASSAIREAGRFAVTALEHGKHLVLMNAEIDLIFGPALLDLARRNGVVCTSCDGDQHGVIKRIVDEIELWGFQPVMAGNMKGFLNRDANPTTIVPEADKRKLDYRMCTAYTDGTKLNIEMALVANALGGRTATPGMHGPAARHVDEVAGLFDFTKLWDSRTLLVDYVLGAQPGGGVFVVGYCDHPYQRDMMAYYKMGPGPFYTFYRPYHLCHVESMRCIAQAALDHEALLAPEQGWQTNVYAYAKKDLRAGDTLDGLGGYTCYGLIENCRTGGESDGLPICLAEDLTLLRDRRRGERLTLQDVTLPEDRMDVKLYRRSLPAAKAVAVA